jgi:hypothetical protein
LQNRTYYFPAEDDFIFKTKYLDQSFTNIDLIYNREDWCDTRQVNLLNYSNNIQTLL